MLQWLQEIDDGERRQRLFFALAPLWSAVNAQDTEDSPYRRMIGLSAAQSRRAGSSSDRRGRGHARNDARAQIEQWLEEILAAWRTHIAGTRASNPGIIGMRPHRPRVS